MADGTTKPIAEIEIGDRVLATDPETGQTSAQTVTAVWIHDDTLIDLELEDGATVTTTADHPFWNHTDQQWQTAETLDSGDQLLTARNQQVNVIRLNQTTQQTDTAYNLTISNIHTYYVLAGNTPVLVHNCGPMDLNFNQVRERIANHVTPLHGYGTDAMGTKFASNLSDDDLYQGLVNRLDPSNATGLTNAAGNHQHLLPWQGAGANGEDWVEVWISPLGELGGMWPVAGPR